MRSSKNLSAVVFAVVIAAIVAPTSIIADDSPPPRAEDITVIVPEGASGRLAQESSILMTNASDEYDYRIEVGTGCGQPAVFTSNSGTSRAHEIPCNLPNPRVEGSASADAGTAPPAEVGNCTCVAGSYRVTGYRAAGTGLWFRMSVTDWRAVAKTEQTDEGVEPDRRP